MKQVPDTTEVRIHPETNTLVREGVTSIINPFDTYAIEEAVRLRERLGGGRVTVLSMGPPQAEASLRESLSVGADEGVLLSDRAFAGADTWATSYTLATALRGMKPDLILCGKQAIDGDTAQVGPGISVHLGIPQVCYVSKIREIGRERAVVECLLEEGHEVLEVGLPCVMTVVKEINEPRLPSLKGMIRAKKAAITVLTAEDIRADARCIGLTGSPTQVRRIFSPPRRSAGEIIEGTSAPDKAARLFARLKELQVL
ncbi:MAG: electron transfer flavoprotein subunit beta/FixA family protein [Planctomycetota bacterium]